MLTRMKEIREYEGISQIEISKILNVPRSTYSCWENNISNIPLYRLNDFCNYFNISLDYVTYLSDNNKKNIIKNNLNKTNIGKRLREIRKNNNHTQVQTANNIKISQEAYSDVEIGKFFIKVYPLVLFCKYYKISMDWICDKLEKNNDTKN